MSVQLTTNNVAYFLKPREDGKQSPVSQLELSALLNSKNPKFLGKVVQEKILEDSLLAELMAMGNELKVSADQVVWQEEDPNYNPTIISGDGAVTKTGNDFKINASALPVDSADIDKGRPTEPKWLQVKVGMHFRVFTKDGKTAVGVVTAISDDKKTLSATPVGGNWKGVDGDNLTIIFMGNNLDHCQLAPCIGYSVYSPTRENTMFKDSECYKYCEETEVANSVNGIDAQPLTAIGGNKYNLDDKLDQVHKILTLKTENTFAFAKRLTKEEAGNGTRGTEGFFETIEKRGTKHLGYIETKADLMNLFANMRQNKIKNATLRVSNEQYSKLLSILDANSTMAFDPTRDITNELISFGFAGFRFGSETIRFKRWDVLDRFPSIGARYHWVLIPDGRVKITMNNRRESAGYLNIVWFASPTKTWKYLRERDEQRGGNITIDVVNKFMPLVVFPEKFMLGCSLK